MAGESVLIERVYDLNNSTFGADLRLDRERGIFFALVGGKRIESEKKADAIVHVRAALRSITRVEWRQVILLRVVRKRHDDYSAEENFLSVFEASCSFTYFRRERARHPFKAKLQIERQHEIDFEALVAAERKKIMTWEKPHRRKERADSIEAELRHRRTTLANVQPPFSMNDRHTKEYELPYSAEAWAGIERISATLREAQARLDTFAQSATADALAKLGAGAGPLLLLAAPTKNTEVP